MKQFLILAFLFSGSLHAQTLLNFDRRVIDCQNQWVVFQPKNGAYDYGFVYFDIAAGLTLQYKGNFVISANGIFVQKTVIDTGKIASVKIRLQPSNWKVAIFPPSRYQDLHITGTPDWLKFYQTDTSSVGSLYHYGFLYNAWDESRRALSYLERAQAVDSNYKGLEFELGYAHNALEQYDKALPVLERALQSAPNDCYLYKELSYAQMHLGQLDEAVVSCQKGITYCSDKAMKAEIAFNLCYQYYLRKDKDKFVAWANEVTKWATTGDRFSSNVEKMKADLAK